MVLFISLDRLEIVLPSSRVMISLGGILLLYSLERFRRWLGLSPEVFPRIFSILFSSALENYIRTTEIITTINLQYKKEICNLTRFKWLILLRFLMEYPF